MTEKKYVLGIDNGGTFTKAGLFDTSGNFLALAQTHADIVTPAPLFTERELEPYWQANVNAIRSCLDQAQINPDEIAALAVTGHGNGLYLARKDFSAPRNGIISTDARAQSFVDRWVADPDYERRVRSKTGSQLWAGQPVPLLAWLDEHEPDIYDQTDYILSAKDYIRFRLTGIAAMEASDGCGIALSNVVTREIVPDLFEFFGIERWMSKIPPFIDSTDIAGYITDDVARLTGLTPGTPVAGGMMDVAAGAIAAGLVQENQLCVITGTWSINEIISFAPRLNEPVFWTTCYAIPNSWLILEGGPNGVSNLDWYINQVIRSTLKHFGTEDLSDAKVFEICEQMISGFTPDVQDPFFLPYINGTSLIPEGMAGFIGFTGYHDIRHMVRAVYEGVIFSHMYHIKKLRHYTELTGRVRFTGGAANSSMWTQMFADAIGLPLDIVDTPESGCLGTAICAAVAARLHPDYEAAVTAMTRPPRATVTPNPEYADLFQRRFARFEAYLDSFITQP